MADETEKSVGQDLTEPEGEMRLKFSVTTLIMGWATGLAALVVLVGFILHFGDIEQFFAIIRSADPWWLVAAVLCQAATYVCAAATWSRTLANSGLRHRLSSLLGLSVIELFVNQAVPTGGLSGSLVVVRGLRARGIPSSIAAAALLIAAASYYAAYLLSASVAFVLLWLDGYFNEEWLIVLAVFVVIVGFLAWLIIAAARSGDHLMPRFMLRWKMADRLTKLLAQIRIDFIRNRRVLIETVPLQAIIFVLDATTLYCICNAMNAPVGFSAAFSSFMLASAVATIAPIPLGLGTFEATSTAMLHLLGTSTEGALAATLVLRGLTFWLPMVPGLWLLFRENRRHRMAEGGTGPD